MTRFQDDTLKRLAQSICRLRRQVAFSAREFVHTIVGYFANDPTTPEWLLLYCKLATLVGSALNLDLVILDSPAQFLLQQLHQVLSMDTLHGCQIFQEYIGSMVLLADVGNSQAKELLDALLEKDRALFVNWSIQMSTLSLYELYLQLLCAHPSLNTLGDQTRRQIILQDLHQLLLLSQGMSVESVAEPKAVVCAATDPIFVSRISILAIFANCFGEFNAQTQWPTFMDEMINQSPAQGTEGSIKESGHRHTILLLAVFSAGCKSSGDEEMAVRAVQIIEDVHRILSQAFTDARKETIQKVLECMQILLYHLGPMIQFTYTQWFIKTFVHSQTTLLTSKRLGQLFLDVLGTMVPNELPAVLQIHVRALTDHPTLSAAPYIRSAKEQLIKLGMAAHPNHDPPSIVVPVASDRRFASVSGSEDITNYISTFERTGSIPNPIWEGSIFRVKWFRTTFLPALIAWHPDSPQSDHLLSARNELIEALRRKNKIPEPLYQEFLSKNKM
ncbi:uncharacterized protein BYT42DRAFT_241451 [Radiomyces spectabilis]|uniref:uncharacterized protein n=1 Tax=Radiomyces spectabilis TaxID=64574 RepID=UPI00221EAA5C|nr:uncharacterized protein BYT42DRAFT_241451 [Radiomyces spectabilis]KAI8388622.1 hypothetical protein BYT42DRAFT_241451 [Radiomyces spectabilis]